MTKNCIVFGGHSPIAISISKKLSSNFSVFHFTRKIDEILQNECLNNPNIVLEKLILSRDSSIDISKTLNKVIDLEPDSIIFANRYRNHNFNPLHAYKLEVMMPAEILNYYSGKKANSKLRSVIFLSSPAGSKIVLDQNAYYHTSKAAINQLVRYYSLHLRGARVNAILPGSFVMKERSRKFYESRKRFKKAITDFIPTNKFVETEDISNLILFLNSDVSGQVNGQLITIDGGYRNWEESAYLISRFKR